MTKDDYGDLRVCQSGQLVCLFEKSGFPLEVGDLAVATLCERSGTSEEKEVSFLFRMRLKRGLSLAPSRRDAVEVIHLLHYCDQAIALGKRLTYLGSARS